ncbi:MAG: cation:proton antiporter [Coriobacteriia bacterium]|nr:cation:proton antiporter [Coriobacteriia bacterium]
MQIVVSLLLILAASTIVGALFRLVKLPAVVGQLLVGVLLGPAVLNWLRPGAIITDFAEIGLILLMFLAGIEAEIPLLKRYLKPALTVAIGGVIVPFVCFFLIGMIWHIAVPESLFWGLIFAATSVSITVEALKEMGHLRSSLGATILGAAVIDDIIAVLLVSVFMVLFPVVGQGSAPATSLPMVLGMIALFAVGLFVCAEWLIRPLLSLSSRIPMEGAETLVSLVICLAFAYVAYLCGLSAALGAFFAGLIISDTDTPINIDVTEKQVSALGSFCFIPVFFASIGLQLRFMGLKDSWLLIVVLCVAAVVSKLLGAGLGAKAGKFSNADALRIGAGMTPRGEMALIIVTLGLSSGILSRTYYSAIVIAIIVATVAAPILLRLVLPATRLQEEAKT